MGKPFQKKIIDGRVYVVGIDGSVIDDVPADRFTGEGEYESAVHNRLHQIEVKLDRVIGLLLGDDYPEDGD